MASPSLTCGQPPYSGRRYTDGFATVSEPGRKPPALLGRQLRLLARRGLVTSLAAQSAQEELRGRPRSAQMTEGGEVWPAVPRGARGERSRPYPAAAGSRRNPAGRSPSSFRPSRALWSGGPGTGTGSPEEGGAKAVPEPWSGSREAGVAFACT